MNPQLAALMALAASSDPHFVMPPSLFQHQRWGKRGKGRAAFRNAVERRHRRQKAARKQKTLLRRRARSCA